MSSCGRSWRLVTSLQSNSWWSVRAMYVITCLFVRSAVQYRKLSPGQKGTTYASSCPKQRANIRYFVEIYSSMWSQCFMWYKPLVYNLELNTRTAEMGKFTLFDFWLVKKSAVLHMWNWYSLTFPTLTIPVIWWNKKTQANTTEKAENVYNVAGSDVTRVKWPAPPKLAQNVVRNRQRNLTRPYWTVLYRTEQVCALLK